MVEALPMGSPDHELTSNGTPPKPILSGPNPAADHVADRPPAQHTNNMGYDGPPPQVVGLAEQDTFYGGQCDGVSHPPEIAQDIPMALGLSWMGYNAPPTPIYPRGITNNGAVDPAPPPANAASPSRGIPGPVSP